MLVKPKSDIQQIKKGGKILGEILSQLVKLCQPGVSTAEIDEVAERMILKAGGLPAFKGYKNRPEDIPFPSTICASLNHELVHGIARKDVILKDGDIFSMDIGMEWPVEKKQNEKIKSLSRAESRDQNNGLKFKKGFFTDTAITVAVGEIPNKTKELMKVTKEALEIGIRAIKPGKSIASIGRAIEKYVSSAGKYGIVRDLVGHGVGHDVHEDPRIPNYYDPKLEKFIIKTGMVLAIEPMISLGNYKVKTGPDGWTIVMADGSLCAHYEHTVVVTDNGCEVATRRPEEKK